VNIGFRESKYKLRIKHKRRLIKMKRTLLVFMALVMAFSLVLTGCSSSGSGKDTGSSPSTGTSGSTGSSGSKAPADEKSAYSEPGVLPIVEEKVDLEIMLPYYSYVTDYEDNKFTKMMEEKTNVHVVFNLLPETEATDKLNLVLSSGADLPDVVMNTQMTNESLIMYGSQGLFIPLNDLIEEHGFYLYELFEAYDDVETQLTAPDGNIYSLPDYTANMPNRYSQRFWINTTFMDTLGIDKMPETTEEYYEYLKAVKTGDPNGNGKADEIPVVGATTGWHHNIDGFLMCSFIYNDSSRYVMTDETGTIDFAANKPEWKQGLEYLKKLTSEGLLDPVSFTQDKEGLRSLVELEEAMIVGSCPSGGTHEFANTNGTRKQNYAALPPLEGPNGVRVTWYDKYAGVRGGQFMITKDCEIPEIAFKWGDFCFQEDVFKWNRYGEPGVDWVEPEEGSIGVNGKQAQYREILKWGAPQNSHWGGAVATWSRFASDAREVDPDDPYELEYVLFNAYKAYEPYTPEYVVPNFYFTVDEAREYTELFTTITDYVKEMTARFVTSDADLDAEWDSYVEELDNIGVDRYLEIMQGAFERQWRATW
jgi:putative aldouronate transport system substrate-binding protein